MQTIAQAGGRSERVMVSVRIPKSIDRALERVMADLDKSKQQLIEEAIGSYLRRRKVA